MRKQTKVERVVHKERPHFPVSFFSLYDSGIMEQQAAWWQEIV